MYDDKWPQLTVTGPPVSPEQAEQILIRTDTLYLTCNNQEWTDAACQLLTGCANPWALPTANERIAALQAQIAVQQRLGMLRLEYLGQNRVANSLKGSSGGWCDWDGTLGARPYNIGKWPGEDEITGDWKQIAEAFPFLRLRSQLASFPEHHIELRPRVWGTWTVEDGAASFDRDATEPLELGDLAPAVLGEHPLGLDVLAGIVERVWAATPAAKRQNRDRRGSRSGHGAAAGR